MLRYHKRKIKLKHNEWFSLFTSNCLKHNYIRIHQVQGILTLTLHGNSNIYIDSQFAKRQKGNVSTYQVINKT